MKSTVRVVAVLLILMMALAGCGTDQGQQNQAAQTYNYISPEELKGKLEAQEDLILLDILVEEAFAKGHITGSISTCAYPVESEEDRAKLAAVLPKLQENDLPIVIVCPRGGGGAKRTFDYLAAQGIATDRLLILEGGFEGWPYPEFVSQATQVLDREKGEVRIKAKVNSKYFETATIHGVSFEGGSNGEKALLAAFGNEKDFHNLLLELGAKPGNNLGLGDEFKGKLVEGDLLEVTLTWDGLGKEIPLGDAIVQSGEAKPIQIRFGGNLERAEQFNTGCILCFNSCPVGITSNASEGFGSSDAGGTQFRGNKDVLPPDGTVVTVTFRLAD